MQLIDGALSILSGADRQLEVTAHNIANMTASGYRARHSFQALTATEAGIDGGPTMSSAVDFRAGKMQVTGNPYDLAITSDGFFSVRQGDQVRYTRDGAFRRDGDGRLVNGEGWALQADNGDLILRSDKVSILADGTVLDDGEPVARILLKDFADHQALRPVGRNAFDAAGAEAIGVDTQAIRQAALESSNVSNAQEMIAMMRALRSAESGQRLVQVYDELLGQAITSFGQVQA